MALRATAVLFVLFVSSSSTFGQLATHDFQCRDGSNTTYYSIPIVVCGSLGGYCGVPFVVDDDSANTTRDYALIQDAIDASTNRKQILVCPGTYSEKLDVHTNVKLEGLEGATRTIIDAAGTGDGTVVHFTNAGYFEGFTVQGGASTLLCFYGAVKVGGMNGSSTAVNTVYIRNNKIVNNVACRGGAIYVSGASRSDGTRWVFKAVIQNNIIRGNELTTMDAGGIYVRCDDTQETLIENNVIAFNESPSGPGGVYYNSNASTAGYSSTDCMTLRNNIFYENVGSPSTTSVVRVFLGSSHVTPVITYNDAYSNSNDTIDSAGTGNLNVNPSFANTINFPLAIFSACRNAGDPSSSLNDRNGTRNDMGAWGGPHATW